MLHSFAASGQVTLQVSNFLESCIACWTAERLEGCMESVYVPDLTILSIQLNILFVHFDTSSCKFPNLCAVKKIDVVYENIDR